MLQFAGNYPIVGNALPSEQRDILKLHRDYVSTIIYTLVGKPYVEWVEGRIKERNQKLEADHDMMVYLDPEIAEILHKSTTVSSKSDFVIS